MLWWRFHLYGKVNPRIKQPRPQLFLRRKNRIIPKIYNGSGEVSCIPLPFACQRMRQTIVCDIPREPDTGGTLRICSMVLTVYDGLWETTEGKAVKSGIPGVSSATQQRVGMRCARRAVIGLDHRPGPTPKRVWTGKIARLCNKALISFGCVHLCRV